MTLVVGHRFSEVRIMTASAAVAAGILVEVFDHVPEYGDYDHSDRVRDHESAYRVAMGRVAKAWGDQLLDVVENPGSPLSRQEARTIDALLERISEVFQHLNRFDEVELDEGDDELRTELRASDSSILDNLEETARLMRELRTDQGPRLWLHDHAGPMYRRLRRLARQLERRNRALLTARRAEPSCGESARVHTGARR